MSAFFLAYITQFLRGHRVGGGGFSLHLGAVFCGPSESQMSDESETSVPLPSCTAGPLDL